LFIIFKVLIVPQFDVVAIEKPLKRFRKHDEPSTGLKPGENEIKQL
jgi:hypothetical protein